MLILLWLLDYYTAFASVAHIRSYKKYLSTHSMISHDTLYTLANSLGVLAMVTAVGYHVIAVNERHLGGKVAETVVKK
jgi:hypothetical protein